MTNLTWIVNHKLAEIISDLCETNLNECDFNEILEKNTAVAWLFKERKEPPHVQLPKNNE